MEKLVCATNNPNKLREITAILAPYGYEVLSLKQCGLDIDPEETGTTFEENAYIKAKVAFDASGLAAIADDSGLEVDALGGEPGVYSARYGGKENDHERNMFLLWNLKDVPASNRAARFVSCICCIFPDGRKVSVRGECEGTILFEGRGDGGFGYDPLFLFPEIGRTMAEISAEEKNRISHRSMALKAFTEEMEKLTNGNDR